MKRLFTYILLTSIAIACHVEMPLKPVSRFKFTPENGCRAPCTVTFTSESENAAGFQWDFGDGLLVAGGKQVTHTFEEGGDYQVKLIAKGVDGGASGATQTVKINDIAPISLSGGANIPTDIVSDAEGNIYISGTGKGTIQFGNEKIGNLTKGSEDFFVAKYNKRGECEWVYADGSSGEDHANALVLDSNNDVYVTGFFSGPLASGVASGTKGNLDGFVTKIIGSSGVPEWCSTFGGPMNDQGRSLAFDERGEGPKIYLVGVIEGNNQKYNYFTDSGVQADARDGFLILLDAIDGHFGQPNMINGPDVQVPETITVDDQGNAYIAGAFLTSIKFDKTTLGLKSVDTVDVFVVKWRLIGGVFQWVQQLGSPGVDFAYDIILDKSKNVYVTGMHSGTVDKPSLLSNGDENTYLAKWNSNGEVQRGNNGFNDGSRDYHGGIALTETGNIVIAGSFADTGQFPMATGARKTGKGSTDILLTEVEPNDLTATNRFVVSDGGNQEDRVNKICITKSGYVYVVGWFKGSSTFKEVPLTGMLGVSNTFIVRYKL
jgi:PKD repeat protein